MPSPVITCEFCSTEIRRNTYASHVKAKHVKEIGKLLFEDFQESNYGTIQNYAKSLSATALPIDSKIYPEAEYWFGEQPLFYMRTSASIPNKYGERVDKQKPYPEDAEKTAYLRCEKNQQAHIAFIEEALSTISFLDFIKAGKEIRIKNPEEAMIRSELKCLKETHQNLIDATTREIEYLKREVELWKETAEEKETIKPLKDENAFLRAKVNRMTSELTALKEKWTTREEEFSQIIADNNKRHLTEMDEFMNRDEEFKKKLAKEKEINEKLQLNVKKEAQKLFDKEEEKKMKEKEKKEKLKKKLKKDAKKAKKLAELSSDSDSDSSDDE